MEIGKFKICIILALRLEFVHSTGISLSFQICFLLLPLPRWVKLFVGYGGGGGATASVQTFGQNEIDTWYIAYLFINKICIWPSSPLKRQYPSQGNSVHCVRNRYWCRVGSSFIFFIHFFIHSFTPLAMNWVVWVQRIISGASQKS